MGLLNYIINLSIFSLMVSTPLVIRSYFNHKPLVTYRYWVSIYSGIMIVILVALSFQHEGYTYDIRYAPVILVFAYFGPSAGIITGSFALLARLASGGHWSPAIVGWSLIIIGCTIISYYAKNQPLIKRLVLLFVSYIFIYIFTVPVLFNAFRDKPLFHLQYLVFVLLGVIIGALLIESYEKLYKTILEKKRIEKILRTSETKFRLITENTSDLIIVLHKDHSVSYYSPSHEFVLGYKVEELTRMSFGELIHPDDIEAFKASLIKMFEDKVPRSVEFRLKHKMGHWIDFESRCKPVKSEDDVKEHIVIISRDISERKKSEEILIQSEKLSIVGELAAGVAHEIRNPLTTIKGFIQLYKKDPNTKEYNELILGELDRIENITSELLALGKPQAIRLNQTNIRELIENTLELLSPQALLDDIQFRLNCDSDTYLVTCEKNQLKQVFLNILKNAIESMHEGGFITIDIKSVEGKCIITFEDQGCGIPEEILPRLGEPFYTLKEKGTGLGLMICHKIIKDHHGTIMYQSKIGEGTKVKITLPMS